MDSSVGGNLTVHVESDASETVTGHRTLVVGTEQAPSALSSFTFGQHSIAARRLRLRAEEEIVIEVGESQIRIDADGLHFVGGSIAGSAKTSLAFTGAGASMKLDGQAAIEGKKFQAAGSGATLSLDSKAVLEGSKVELGSGSGSKADKDKKTDEELDVVRVKLVDPVEGPWKQRKFVVTSDDYKIEGTTDGAGVAKFKTPKKAKTAQLRLWTNDEGESLVVDLVLDAKPLGDDPSGVLHRLQHLGYFTGFAENWGPAATEAVLLFQAAHLAEGLEPFGRAG
ncbi:MAG: hypothetical protein IPJ34_40995 [Myxococcales bacterium]|nr:hypothetical protein [Myxococcales bacterium]